MISTRRYNRFLSQLIENLFEDVEVWLPPMKNLMFLCGAASNDSARYTLKNYFHKRTDLSFQVILAEDFFAVLDEKYTDLLTLENYLANYSDCILIILESPGAIAELGAFSNGEDEFLKKLLILNENKYASDNSFINKGPIEKIRKKTKFGILGYDSPENVLVVAEEILDKMASNKRIRSFKEKLGSLSMPLESYVNIFSPTYIILELIRLLAPISKAQTCKVVKTLSGWKDEEINRRVSLLLALKHIEQVSLSSERSGNYYLVPRKRHNEELILRLKQNEFIRARAKVLKIYLEFNAPVLEAYYEHCRK